MSDAPNDSRFLEMFPSWLQSLGEDAAALGEVLASPARSDESTRYLASGLNYIFKSLDLIPDGIDDLGFLDDAFVLRTAASLAVAEDEGLKSGVVERLANDARAVAEFLGDDFNRLEAYVKGLRKGAARGRTVDDIVGDSGTRGAFLQEVSAWAQAYQAPSFTRDAKTLVKLKAFLNAKLP